MTSPEGILYWILEDLILKPEPDTSWMEDAACRGMGADMFYAERGQNYDTIAAKQVCQGCPVREQCFDYAVVHFEENGVWGGGSEVDFRRARKAKIVKQPI